MTDVWPGTMDIVVSSSPSSLPIQSSEDTRPSHLLNSRLSVVDHFAASGDALNATSGLRSSRGTTFKPRSSTVTDLSNRFAPTKLHGAKVQVFADDVLMEGELTKTGESLLYTWTNVWAVVGGVHVLSIESARSAKRIMGPT